MLGFAFATDITVDLVEASLRNASEGVLKFEEESSSLSVCW
jgi:hypothetical protein